MGRVRVLSVVALAFAWGCSDDPTQVLPGAGTTARQSAPIMGGSPPDAPKHDAVVSLHRLSSDGSSVYVSPFCSGTLISDTVVLTAAHCLVESKGKRVRAVSPSSIAVYVGDRPSVDILQHLYPATEVAVHPQYNDRALTDDIALIRLASPVTEPVSPVPALPSSQSLTSGDIGTPLNFAGFGVDENGNSGVKLQVDVPLGGFGCTVGGCQSSGDAATQFSYSQPTSGPCSGDSGGPAFIDRGGVTYVAGVTSYGDQACVVYGVSTRADAYEGFIQAFAGGGGGGGDGGDGGTPSGCGDGTCSSGESCDGRSGTTACPSDCPGKVNGKPSGRFCYVGASCEGPGC